VRGDNRMRSSCPNEASLDHFANALPGSGATLPEAAKSRSRIQHNHGKPRRVDATVHLGAKHPESSTWGSRTLTVS
jgi:hypothetical protein